MDEVRVVARYAAESAEVVLHLFEEVDLDDPRPREAIEAAHVFAHGARRTRLQRVTAVAAHRAARDVSDEAAQHAARAAGDAAAAAYSIRWPKPRRSATSCGPPPVQLAQPSSGQATTVTSQER